MFFFPRIGNGKGLLFAGGLFILFGVLIAAYPQILVALISSFFLFIGLILFMIGLRMYQASKRKNATQSFVEQDQFWRK